MNEQTQIDQMINEGKISPDQARELKNALHESKNSESDMAFSSDSDEGARKPAGIWPHTWKILIVMVIALAFSIKVKPMFFFLLLLLLIMGCIAALLLLGNNFLVWKNEKVRQSKALVQNEIARKSALVPQLREVVYGYSIIETDAIEKTTQMRGAHVSSPLVLAKESMSSIGRAREFQAIVENYPQLNSNEGFTKLLNELIETEGRITAMVKWYNYQAGLFNGVIESFPFSVAAAIFGLQKAAYLE